MSFQLYLRKSPVPEIDRIWNTRHNQPPYSRKRTFWIEDFCRLRRSCRSASQTRIGEIAGAASAAGWPDRIRYIRLQSSKKLSRRLRRPLQMSFGHRPPSTVLHSPACPTSLGALEGSRRTKSLIHILTVGQGGLYWTVEVELELETPKNQPPQAGTPPSLCLAAKGCIEPHQASQRRPQRRRCSIFEPAMPIGTNDANEKHS
jgi:hypothetical protein